MQKTGGRGATGKATQKKNKQTFRLGEGEKGAMDDKTEVSLSNKS